ncbi:MAG: hypothetical protein RL272_997 [Candidatus Parcubacteria bacterium]|jgi:RNA polymerase sigma-70 factor (ECF subfamily)
MDEEQLIGACQRGESDAFGRLYDAYVRRIYDFVYYRTHHKETAEDLTSDVFLKAFAKMDGFDAGKGTFAAWLYRIARNRVIDHYRASKRVDDIEDVWDLLRSGNDVARDADARERLRETEAHMAALPAAQRDIVIMRAWDGLSYAEIAEITGKSESACKMSFSRAVAALRKRLPLAALLIILTHPLR